MTAAHDPGGKVRTKLANGMFGWAHFSECDRYRHVLGRYWGDSPEEFSLEPYALWIGMNPSTATAEVNDPTITREIAFTKALGLQCMVKCNVMDYRATKPRDLIGVQACSPGNVAEIVSHARLAEKVIAAWGEIAPGLRWSYRAVVVQLRRDGVPLWCLGTTKQGFPRHPLYVPKATQLMEFRP